jgi:circadian clock protein KaiB
VAKAEVRKSKRSLRLYVAGRAPNSVRAIANIMAICDPRHGSIQYALEIVDVLKEPRRALADGVVVTPTLIRVSPLPVQRIVGDLSDTGQVLLTLSDE